MVIIISGSGCEAKRRKNRRCIAKPIPHDQHRRERTGQQAVRPSDNRKRDVHTEHIERAVGDVDDAHHAEYQREPAGDQKQQGGREQTVEGLCDEVDQVSERAASTARTRFSNDSGRTYMRREACQGEAGALDSL
jgi:hypothetical protein